MPRTTTHAICCERSNVFEPTFPLRWQLVCNLPKGVEPVSNYSDLEAERRREHFEKFDDIAKRIGVVKLEKLVPATKQQIVEALKTDPHLNNIPLIKWDRKDPVVRKMAFRSGFKTWSLSYTVCVLKHVAAHYIAKEKEDRGSEHE